MSATTYPNCPECGSKVTDPLGTPTCTMCGVEASAWNYRTGTVSRWISREAANEGRRALRRMMDQADEDQWTRWGDAY